MQNRMLNDKNWIFISILQQFFSDDTNDGVASSIDNCIAKNDERPGNQKRNGTNASEHECSKSGK